MTRLRWTPEMRQEVRELRKTKTAPETAAILSKRWGTLVTPHKLRSALSDWAFEVVKESDPGEVWPDDMVEDRPPASTTLPVVPVAERGAGAAVLHRAERRVIPERVQATRQIAILADIHVPDQDTAAVAVALAIIRERQPDEVVILGDLGEFESCSQHGPSLQRYADDLAAVRGFLAQLAAAAPNARLTLLEGNHETRFRRTVASIVPTLAGTHSLDMDLGLEELGVEYIPEDQQPIRRGSLDLLHGHQLPGSAKHFAARLAELYGAPGRTIVMGHVHRHQSHRKPMAGGDAVALSLPCLRRLRPGWLHGSEAGWSLGMGWATVLGERTALEVIAIEDGVAVWGGRVYRAG